MRPTRPAFHSVIDLGLRDVGVRNEPRRLAAHFGKALVPLVVLHLVSVLALCAIVRRTGADAWLVIAFPLAWTAVVWVVAVRTVKRSPVAVVKVRAEGANQAVWLLIVPFLCLALGAVLVWDLRLVPIVVLTVMMAVLLWRARGVVPDMLRNLRALLAWDESVLGDGLGLAKGIRKRHDAPRLVVATDRRLLVATSSRSTQPLPLLDVPYERVSSFGVEWKSGGRVGVLSVTLAPSETHVITGMAPANLVSIARALLSNGVYTDDPAAVSEAERLWEEAQRRDPRSSRARLIDRAAMSTKEFDLGLWLLLGLLAVAFYVNPLGVGLAASSEGVPVLLAVPVLCAVCGYVSGTRSSVAYVAPLNLLVTPAFFFADAGDVVSLMVVLSALAIAGLWVGSALRRAPAGSGPGRRAARGSLRHAISGPSLIRISGVLLAVMAALVTSASAAGFELTSVRLAVEEATAQRLPVDGRSNLNGNAASLTYTPGPGLRELVTDEPPLAGPNDGARWELRSSFTKGYNVLTLGHYVFEPRLDDAAAIAAFLADKDRAHSRLAGSRVTHTERVVDGRKGYVWNHGGRHGYWYYAAWLPQPVHSVRVECIAKREERRFRRLCAEAMSSLEFHLDG